MVAWSIISAGKGTGNFRHSLPVGEDNFPEGSEISLWMVKMFYTIPQAGDIRVSPGKTNVCHGVRQTVSLGQRQTFLSGRDKRMSPRQTCRLL